MDNNCRKCDYNHGDCGATLYAYSDEFFPCQSSCGRSPRGYILRPTECHTFCSALARTLAVRRIALPCIRLCAAPHPKRECRNSRSYSIVHHFEVVCGGAVICFSVCTSL